MPATAAIVSHLIVCAIGACFPSKRFWADLYTDCVVWQYPEYR